MYNSASIFYYNSFQLSKFTFVYFSYLNFKFIQLRNFYQLLLNVTINCLDFEFFSSNYFFLSPINDWKTFSRNFFFFKFNKSKQRDLNWINLKLRELKWTKKKLEHLNKFVKLKALAQQTPKNLPHLMF